MNNRCPSCGAELFEGQQFCRLCGATVAGQPDEATTRLLGESAPQGAPGTAPVRGGGTEPVGRQPGGYQQPGHGQAGYRQPSYQQPTAYQPPPLSSFQQTSPLPGAQPKKRRGLWLVALLSVFLLGAGVAGAGGYLLWRARHQPKVIIVRKDGPEVSPAGVPAAPLPPDFGERLGEQIRRAMESAGAGEPLDESGARVSGDQTVLTESYRLEGDAAFAVRVVNGDVTVTGTDGDEAEVKITKRGGSAELRRAARVMLVRAGGGLAFVSAGSPPGVEVSYEVRLPRGQRALEISADKGDVKVSDFEGAVSSDVKLGSAEFEDVTGRVRSHVIKGDTRVAYSAPEREGEQEFSVVRGSIEAKLAEGAEAEVRAETTAGDIDADDDFGLSVERRAAGRALSGRLGGGGRPLRFKVTSGDIKLRK